MLQMEVIRRKYRDRICKGCSLAIPGNSISGCFFWQKDGINYILEHQYHKEIKAQYDAIFKTKKCPRRYRFLINSKRRTKNERRNAKD